MKTYTGLLFGGAIIVITWLASVAGVFRLPDAFLYDAYVRLTPEIRTMSSSPILLIEADLSYQAGDDGSWLKVLESVEKMGAARVLFTFLPQNTSLDFYQKAEQYGNVIFGRRLIANPQQRQELIPEKLPAEFSQKIRSGLVVVPSGFHGIYRQAALDVTIDGQRHASLEGVVASEALLSKAFPSDPYFVNFNGKFNGLPKIRIERVLSDDMIPELVQEKTVVIGLVSFPPEPGFHTPLAPSQGMSLLEFHGYALDTLLSQQFIGEFRDRAVLGLIAGVVFIALILSQFLSIRLFSWFILPIMAGYALFTWIVFAYAAFWPPVAEILFAHVFAVLFIFRRHTTRQEQSIRSLLFRTSVTLRERSLPESFYDRDEYWGQIINMVNQTLNLTRAIFLEAVPGEHRVREISALHCSLSDILEKRRDYHRTPYSTAIQENRPIRLEGGTYLTQPQVDEEQYMVPLLFGGRVLGFWTFGIEPDNVPLISNFTSVITNFADQISELLYHREQKQVQQLSEQKRMLRYLQLQGRNMDQQGLRHAVDLLERYLTLLELMFDGVSSAIILYNLFGQVVHVNKRMTELMKNSGILPYTMMATDFATSISTLSPDEVRQVFQQILFERKPVTIPAFLPNAPQKYYRLHIRPLVNDTEESLSDDVSPFQVYGILFELLEITELKTVNQLKNELFDHINSHFRRNFEPIVLAGSLLQESGLSREQQQRVVEILHRRVDAILDFITQMEGNLLKDIFSEEVDYYPINPKQSLENAVQNLREEAALRKLSFTVEVPEAINMVYADPEALADVLAAILAVLMNDAADDSTIRIDLLENEEGIIYNFSNAGFGMPDKVFKQYLFGTQDTDSAEFQRLRHAIQQVKRWGGNIRASSEIGEGNRFTMLLPTSDRQREDNT